MSLSEKALLLKEDIDEVFDKGKQAENAEWWSKYLGTGDIGYAFQQPRWKEELFNPPKGTIIKASVCANAFQRSAFKNLKKHCDDNDYTFDFSGVTSAYCLFDNCTTTAIPETACVFPDATQMTNTFSYCANLTKIPNVYAPKCTRLYSTFSYCPKLTTIEGIDVGACTNFSYWLTGSKLLTTITVRGFFKANVDCKDNPLSLETAKHIITHLENCVGTTSEGKRTLTLSSKTKGYLTTEGATSPNGNTWAEYIVDLGWILK